MRQAAPKHHGVTLRRPLPNPNSTALVLGAGGTLGWVYHLGVLEGLRDVLGWDPATAGRIVGTSAGGAVAGSVLAGATTDDVLAAITEPMNPEQQEAMREAISSIRSRPHRRLRPQAPTLVRRLDLIGLAGLLPAGVFPTTPLRRFPVGGLDAQPWPSNLWMPSVRLRDGEVVVFGRDRLDVGVRDALEATAAVPGMFQPKRIDGSRFVDGAVASATHAELAVESPSTVGGNGAAPDRGPSVVVISSPMTRPGRGVVRSRARRQLAIEIAAVRRSGAATVVLEPNDEIVALAAGYPRSNPAAGPAIVAAARAQTITALG